MARLGKESSSPPMLSIQGELEQQFGMCVPRGSKYLINYGYKCSLFRSILGGFATRLNFVLGEERERERKKKLAMRQGWEISPTRYKDTPHTMIHRSAAFMSDPAIQVTRGKFPGFCPSGLVHDNDNVVGVDIGSHLQGERKLESDIAASLKYRCAADK